MPADRLGPSTPQYSLLTEDDLPSEWLRPVDESCLQEMALQLGVRAVVPTTAVELPDYPWAWHYERWSRTVIDEAHQRDEKPLCVMVVSRSDFRNLQTERQRTEQSAAVLRSLIQTGRPLPLYSRIFGPKP
jgi:hypothetical protein